VPAVLLCTRRAAWGLDSPPASIATRLARALFNPRQLLALIFRHDWRMGDKSLKAKQRDQKQKDAAKVETAAVARAKQERGMRVPQPVSKAAGRA
jgi:hypothetical protein